MPLLPACVLILAVPVTPRGGMHDARVRSTAGVIGADPRQLGINSELRCPVK